MSLYRVEALILKSRNFGEADKILTLFTREHGKLEAVARGVRKIKSKNRGSVQPFSRSSIMLYKGKTTDTVTQCELIEGFPGIREDLGRMAYAGYMAELADFMLPEREKNEEVYLLLLVSLHLLAQSTIQPALNFRENSNIELVARQFEVRLLNILGYQPELENCVLCGNMLQTGKLKFSPSMGGILCPQCQQHDLKARAIERGTIAVWKKLAKMDLRLLNRLKLHQEERTHLEEIISYYLEHFLDRKVKSLDFLKELKYL